jgi:hypothetical protein
MQRLHLHLEDTEMLRKLNDCREHLIAQFESKGLDNLGLDWKVSQLADEGDFDQAVSLLRARFPSSRVWYHPLYGVAGLGEYRDQSAALRDLERDVVDHINAERAKLGYGPMQSAELAAAE